MRYDWRISVFTFLISYFIFKYFCRIKYVEQELAKKRGRTIDSTDQAENDLKRAEDELYKIPDHLKVTDPVSSLMNRFYILSYSEMFPPCLWLSYWCI